MRRFGIALFLTALFGSAMYTTLGCGGSSPTSPAPEAPPPATIHGVVTNAVTHAPVVGALVASRMANGNEYNTQTDQSGRYTTFSAVGTMTLAVRAADYKNYERSIVVQAGSNNVADVELQPNPIN